MNIDDEIKQNEGLIGKVIKDMHFTYRNFDDYEEAYSLGRIGLYKAIKTYNGEVKKSTYYYKCIKNAVKYIFQKKKTKRVQFNDNAISIYTEYDYKTLLEGLANETNIEGDMIQKETQKEIQHQVRKVIEKLKPNYQKILKLKFGIGCNPKTTKEIAAITGTTQNNICDLYKKAKRDFEREWVNDNRRCKE